MNNSMTYSKNGNGDFLNILFQSIDVWLWQKMTKIFGQNWHKRMEANVDKSHLLESYNENCSSKIEDFSIKNSM